MEREKQEGNVEYKLKIVDKDNTRIEELTTQLRYRMNEGIQECKYIIGVNDDGSIEGITNKEYEKTMENLKIMCDKNNYCISNIVSRKINKNLCIYEILIREKNNTSYINLKVCMCGSVDSGKSSTLSVLVNGIKDNGRGLARDKICNYIHEIKFGRTSSISHQILGFDYSGNITNYSDEKINKLSWNEIVNKSKKIVSFYDLCGHEKYLKTTITGLSTHKPDISMIIVSANSGKISNITREHIYICIVLKIPFIFVITKMDIIEKRREVYNETIQSIHNFLKIPGIRKLALNIKNDDDVSMAADKIYSEGLTPIFEISNVSGSGIQNLTKFYNLLSPRLIDNTKKDILLYIDSIFNVKGVGLVVGGNLISGTLEVGNYIHIGPFSDNNYKKVQIKSIHCKRVSLEKVDYKSYVCMNFKGIDKKYIRKGQVCLSPNISPKSYNKFTAKIHIIKTHSTTIKLGFEPIVHVNSIRQPIKLIKIIKNISSDNNEIIRAGERAICQFQFLLKNEFIQKKDTIYLTSGLGKGYGVITEIF